MGFKHTLIASDSYNAVYRVQDTNDDPGETLCVVTVDQHGCMEARFEYQLHMCCEQDAMAFAEAMGRVLGDAVRLRMEGK